MVMATQIALEPNDAHGRGRKHGGKAHNLRENHGMPMSDPSKTPTHPFQIRPAVPADAAACVRLRGMTRENAISEQRLAEVGVTVESWAADIANDVLPGFVALGDNAAMAGYCFGARETGEVVVLALLPEFEGQGLGRQLLAQVVNLLQAAGHKRLFLGCSNNPQHRSHGFYRHLGWRGTGRVDRFDDEELEFFGT
jgi:ribosomal protein S18 acetylase RimI-like enzyme